MFCTNCGCEIKGGNFCPVCGNPLDKNFIPREQQNSHQPSSQSMASIQIPSNQCVQFGSDATIVSNTHPLPVPEKALSQFFKGIKGRIIASNILWLIVGAIQSIIVFIDVVFLLSGESSTSIASVIFLAIIAGLNIFTSIHDLASVKYVYTNRPLFIVTFARNPFSKASIIYNTVILLIGINTGNWFLCIIWVLAITATALDIFGIRLPLKKYKPETEMPAIKTT